MYVEAKLIYTVSNGSDVLCGDLQLVFYTAEKYTTVVKFQLGSLV